VIVFVEVVGLSSLLAADLGTHTWAAADDMGTGLLAWASPEEAIAQVPLTA